MKVAQILSTIPDALPREYAEELASLQADAPPMGWLFVKRRMATELGPDWQQKFDQFDRQAVSAASLGQVHRAQLGGRQLAVKLQYPDMASAIDADLRQLGLVFQIYERFDKAISTADIHKELSARLREELDYQREALNMKLYQLMLAEEKQVHVPQPLSELSTSRMLAMDWLDGQKLMGWLETGPDQISAIRLRSICSAPGMCLFIITGLFMATRIWAIIRSARICRLICWILVLSVCFARNLSAA